MDGPTNEQAAKISIHDQVERVAKILPLALAGLYLVGFLIVALHLADYGASSLDLLKIQYLAAGFWFACVFIAFCGFTTAISLSITEQIYRKARNTTGRRSIRKLLVVVAFLDFVAISMGSFMFYIIWRFGRMFNSQKLLEVNQRFVEIGYSMRFLVFSLVACHVLLCGWFSSKEEPSDTSSQKSDARKSRRLFAALAAAAFVLCIEIFSIEVYPTISFSLGGGQPRQVVFWLGTGTASDSFLERDHANPYTVPYELLLENENSFVVISPKDNQRAIEFDRKVVGAVIVLGKRPRLAPAEFQRGVTEPVDYSYEVIERSQKEVPNFMAKGLHTEVDYVLFHDGNKFYATCDTTTVDKLDPTATCAFRVLRSYECMQPVNNEPKKVLSDLRCKDDEGHPVYLYVNKKG